MKRILLSLLACAICFGAYAQLDTSKKSNPGNTDKWETIKGNPKAAKSKLFVSLPEDAHWDMTIYAAGSNKVLSNTLLKKEILLLPGSYDVEINKIRITGVPVEKGKNTRIKAGVLNITTPDAWTLYDETQKMVLINTYSAQNRGLPVGKYVLSILGNDEAIEIKDEAAALPEDKVIETDEWIMTPLNQSREKNEMGILNTTYVNMASNKHLRLSRKNQSGDYEYVIHCGPDTQTDPCPSFHSLKNGEYRIKFYDKLEIINIPLKEGYETRPKVGFLQCILPGDWILFNESKDQQYYWILSDTFKMSLPIGNYYVKHLGEFRRAEIKDGKTTFLTQTEPVTGKIEKKWTIVPSETKTLNGLLNISFPGDNLEPHLSIVIQKYPTTYWVLVSMSMENHVTHPLIPGLYKIKLNNVMLDKVEIQKGKETILKTGYLEIKDNTEVNWFLCDVSKLNELVSGNDTRKIALPVGLYYIKTSRDRGPDYYPVVVKEKQVTSIKWPIN